MKKIILIMCTFRECNDKGKIWNYSTKKTEKIFAKLTNVMVELCR